MDGQFIINLLQKNDLPKINKLKEVVKLVYNKLDKLKKLEKDNFEKVKENKQKTLKSINQVQKGLNLNDSYSGKSKNYEGKYFDQKK